MWDTGTLNVETGELHLAVLVTRGVVNRSGGQTSGGVIEPIGGGRITGSGAALSSIVAVGDTTGHIVPGLGSLTLGDASSPLGFHFLGRLDAPIGDVTLADADSAVVGTVSMIGGVLHGLPGGIHLSLDRRMTGFGTVTGVIVGGLTIISSGASGISFAGPVLGVGQGMNGTRFRFQPGGSFIGFGRIEASIQVDTGAAILPTNDLTLGKAPLASSVTIDGTLAVGPGVEVDLNGTDSTRVTGVITLADGFVGSSTSPLCARAPRRASADALLPAREHVQRGHHRSRSGPEPPALSEADHVIREPGRVRGRQLSGGGVGLALERQPGVLRGHPSYRTLPGYVPVAGDSFLVMSYPARAGGFGTVTINGGPSTGLIQVLYRPTGAYAKILAGPVAVGDPPAAAPRAVQLSSLARRHGRWHSRSSCRRWPRSRSRCSTWPDAGSPRCTTALCRRGGTASTPASGAGRRRALPRARHGDRTAWNDRPHGTLGTNAVAAPVLVGSGGRSVTAAALLPGSRVRKYQRADR